MLTAPQYFSLNYMTIAFQLRTDSPSLGGYETEDRATAPYRVSQHVLDDRTRAGHWDYDDCNVYIGRAGRHARHHLNNTPIHENGWLGNPHHLGGECQPGDELTPAEAIDLYDDDLKQRVTEDPAFRRALTQLYGSTLGCYCRRLHEEEPQCHGDVLAKTIDQIVLEDGFNEWRIR